MVVKEIKKEFKVPLNRPANHGQSGDMVHIKIRLKSGYISRNVGGGGKQAKKKLAFQEKSKVEPLCPHLNFLL